MGSRRFCDTCRVWLNCEKQYEDHLGGRKHKKKLAGKFLETCSTAAPSEAEHFTFDRETHLRVLRVSSSKELAAIGNSVRLIQRAWRKFTAMQ